MIDGTAGEIRIKAEQAAKEITEYLREKCGRNLHYGEIGVLWAVTGKNGISADGIASVMRMPRDAVTEIITGLAAADDSLITLCHGDGDITVWLTPEEQSIADDLNVIFHTEFDGPYEA